MKFFKKSSFIAILFIIVIIPVKQKQALFSLTNSDFSQLKFVISQERGVYSSSEAIYVYSKIINEGDYPVLLRPVSVFHTTFRLVLRDTGGINIPLKVKWILEGKKWNEGLDTSANDNYNRHAKYILLEPGEGFSRKINLQNIYDFVPDKAYILQGYFYPDFIRKREKIIESINWIRFRTQKIPEAEGLKETDSREAAAKFFLSPDEVVFLHLKAEIEKNSVRFLKYLSLTEYIQLFDRFINEYNESGKRGKAKVLNRFKRFLARKRYDFLVDFKVKRVEYDRAGQKKSIVYVDIQRNGGARPMLFEYIYTLRSDTGQRSWLITHLRVIRRKQKSIYNN